MTVGLFIEEHGPDFKKRGKLIFVAAFVLATPIVSQAANQPGERGGKEVVEQVCVACHSSGVNGAPKIGDNAAWNKRASQGLTSLTQNALKGIRQMPAHGGHPELSDLEVGRAVTYMVNQSGGNWVEPVGARDKERSGEQVVKGQCAKCHQKGKDGAPKIGDQGAWVQRMKQGLDYLVRSAVRGHGGMPVRGGSANLTDGEIQNAILYMFNPTAPATGSGVTGGATATRAAAAGPNHVTAGVMDIYLGVVPAARLLSFPRGSPERTMHGGVPDGSDYYHVNISLSDRSTHAPIADAKVDIQVEQVGFSSESKSLELMTSGTASYGNYVRMKRNTSYVIIAEIRAPGSPVPTKARFDYWSD
jgi:cytochrome c5